MPASTALLHALPRLELAGTPEILSARDAEIPDPGGGSDRAAGRNLGLSGVGGLLAPFVGVKLIEVIVHNEFGA